MSNTAYEQLLTQIDNMTRLTRAGLLQWEKVINQDSQYRAIGVKPQLIAVCFLTGCGIKIGDDYSRVHCEDLEDLCREILKQVGKEETVMNKVVKSLDAVLPLQ